MKAVRVGVIGVGFMGRMHAAAYAKMRDVELAGVVDLNASRARRVAEELGAQVYEGVGALVADPRIDAVSVCTNDGDHRPPVQAALAARKHVLVEKPIATTMEDADAMIASAASSDRLLLVGHLLRFEPRYREAKQALDAGSIGTVVSVFARRIGAASTQESLKGRVSVLSFLGIHDFDLCRWYAGAPATRVYCEERRGLLAARGFDVEDQTFSVVRFANNVIACVEAGWILPDTHPRRGDFQLEIVGSDGTINLDLMSGGMAISGSEGYRYPSFGHGLEQELRHFVDCVRGDAEPAIGPTDARLALELTLAAQRSAREGRPIDLPPAAG